MTPYTKRPSVPVSARATSSGSCREKTCGAGKLSTSDPKRSRVAIDVFIFRNFLIRWIWAWADEAEHKWAVESQPCYTNAHGCLYPRVPISAQWELPSTWNLRSRARGNSWPLRKVSARDGDVAAKITMWDVGRTFCYQHRLALENLNFGLSPGDAKLARIPGDSFAANSHSSQNRSIVSDVEG